MHSRGLSKRQQKDRIRNHLAAQETHRSHQMMAQPPPPVPTRLSRTVPSPHRLRHKSQPRRCAHRAQHTTRMAQAPAAIAATSVPAAPPAHIAQLQKNTQRVRFLKAAPPREGVGQAQHIGPGPRLRGSLLVVQPGLLGLVFCCCSYFTTAPIPQILFFQHSSLTY